MNVVLDWLTPNEIKNVQKVLELANYYRQFVKDFVFIVKLLHDLVKKEEWELRQEKSFKALKKWFTMESILVVLDLDKNMRIEVDTLDYAMRGVLSMECSDKQ